MDFAISQDAIDAYYTELERYRQRGVVNDPNRDDDDEGIVRLLEQVVQVSVDTVALVEELRGVRLEALPSGA